MLNAGNFREWSQSSLVIIIPFPLSHPFPTFSTSTFLLGYVWYVMINGYGINGHINYFPTSKLFSNQSPSRQEIFSGWWEAPKPRSCPQRSWRSPWPSGRSSCASSAEIPRRWPWRFPRPVTWWNWKFCWFVCWFLCVVLGWVRWFMFLLFNLENCRFEL